MTHSVPLYLVSSSDGRLLCEEQPLPWSHLSKTEFTTMKKRFMAHWKPFLSTRDYLVLSQLVHHMNHEDGRSFPGQKLIAAKTGYKDRSVRSAIRNLEIVGLIQTRGRTTRSGIISAQRYKLTNEYSVAFHKVVFSRYKGTTFLAMVADVDPNYAFLTHSGHRPFPNGIPSYLSVLED